MTTVFMIDEITVLNMNGKPDSVGDIIPPNAVIDFPKSVVVYWDFNTQRPVGTAWLSKKGNKIVARMKLTSVMSDQTKALDMMRRLYPAVAFSTQCGRGRIPSLTIDAIALTPAGNTDITIKPFGDQIYILPSRDRYN